MASISQNILTEFITEFTNPHNILTCYMPINHYSIKKLHHFHSFLFNSLTLHFSNFWTSLISLQRLTFNLHTHSRFITFNLNFILHPQSIHNLHTFGFNPLFSKSHNFTNSTVKREEYKEKKKKVEESGDSKRKGKKRLPELRCSHPLRWVSIFLCHLI